MVVPNRFGDRGAAEFYGSSFISDPYGRILVQAPRDGRAVLVADLDLDQRRDWLELFPFLQTRRPDTYGRLSWCSGPESTTGMRSRSAADQSLVGAIRTGTGWGISTPHRDRAPERGGRLT